MPNIDDYAKTCMRHPNFETGYHQWLKIVSIWGYDETDQETWSREYYQSLW